MAELEMEGAEIVLHLSQTEKLEAVHGDLREPLSAVRSVEVLEDAHGPADHGFKVGLRLPGHAEVATVYSDDRKIFAAVHHNTAKGVRVVFEGAKYDEWIVGSADPESLKARIEAGL